MNFVILSCWDIQKNVMINFDNVTDIHAVDTGGSLIYFNVRDEDGCQCSIHVQKELEDFPRIFAYCKGDFP